MSLHSAWRRGAIGIGLALGALAQGCAAGGDTGPGGGGMDAATADTGGGTGDTGTPDAGAPDTPPLPDAGPGGGLQCEACTTTADCTEGTHCIDLPTGDRVCLRECVRDLPDCPPRFDCVDSLTAEVTDPLCAPVGERCCVDADADEHGIGVGCDGADCDDEDAAVHADATEACDGVDQDCDGTIDEGPAATLCPPGTHVLTAACVDGACAVDACEPGFGDCDTTAEGCETSLATATDCGACGTPCVLAHATSTCAGGTCAVDTCDAGWGDCNGVDADGCETSLDSVMHCGSCGVACSLPSATSTCAGGTCAIASCDPTWADCDGRATNGCETSVTTNANCGACGVACAPARGIGECSTGTCRITSCSSGFDDCNGLAADGCETSLRSTTDCGACGAPCARAGGTASCAGGSCVLTACNPGLGNCNGVEADGCETSLTSPTHCGGCGMACAPAHATGDCSTGTCRPAACDAGWGDCDGIAANGCEQPLNTLAHCGGCGVACALTNASESCASGTCEITMCSATFGDCDALDPNGCERSLRTLTDCGSCGASCALANATESCSTGTCQITTCSSGFSNCDASHPTGCEVSHAAVSGTCAGATFVGMYDGDRNCGTFCPGNTGWDLFTTRTGRTSAWFRARVVEDSDCPTDIEHQIRLTPPAGTDYDLFVYRPCGTLVGSSRAGVGAVDTVTVGDAESSGSDDSFDYFVEVRWFSGASCGNWTLDFFGHNC